MRATRKIANEDRANVMREAWIMKRAYEGIGDIRTLSDTLTSAWYDLKSQIAKEAEEEEIEEDMKVFTPIYDKLNGMAPFELAALIGGTVWNKYGLTRIYFKANTGKNKVFLAFEGNSWTCLQNVAYGVNKDTDLSDTVYGEVVDKVADHYGLPRYE